jgi:rubrerythrin
MGDQLVPVGARDDHRIKAIRRTDSQIAPTGGSSRRELLLASVAAGAGGAGAALIASCGGSSSKTPSTATVSTAQADSDAAILAALLDQENSSIVAYMLVATKVRGATLASARRFLGHERRHVVALETAIRALGSTPSPPRPRSEYEAGFPRLRGERDALSFALDVETTAMSAYADALGKIATDDVRATTAAILVTESEHASVVLGELGRPQTPDAFITGPPPQVTTP